MSVRNDPRGRRSPVDEEFELEEQEVDLRRYWQRLVRYWWLPVAGLVIGLLAGLLLAAGGKKVFKGEATIYLGQAFTPNGTAQVTGLGANPASVNRIVHDEFVINNAARRSGMKASQIRDGVTSRIASGSTGRRVPAGTAPLILISVKGPSQARVTRATNSIAQQTITRVGVYVNTKIDNLETQVTSKERELTSLETKVEAASAALATAERQNRDALDKLVLTSVLDNAEQRRAAVEGELLDVRQLLNLANQVEKPQIFFPAEATETTARSKRNSMLAGALLGLLLGTVAALVWEPVAERRRRR